MLVDDGLSEDSVREGAAYCRDEGSMNDKDVPAAVRVAGAVE